MKLTEGELTVGRDGKMRLVLSPALLFSLMAAAIGIVGSVWLSTRDLGHEIMRLSKSVDALVVRFGDTDAKMREHDRRIWVLENDGADDR